MSVGKKIAGFLDSFPRMKEWKSSERVWDFQRRFGVEKVAVNRTGSPGEAFQAIDADEYLKTNVSSKVSTRKSAAQNHRNHHIRTPSDASSIVSSSGYSSGAESNNGGANNAGNNILYRIRSRFWFYLFLFGTQLGDETYYAIFFSFWFWNIDGAVGRRLVLVWNLVMYIGQGMKDVVRWPRPKSPPVVQLETKWALEYGMPSTHAMIGLAVPSAILYFTVGRYQYHFPSWLLIAFIWCFLVSSSRLYLGMHSFADIYVGLIFSLILITFVFPTVDFADQWLIVNRYAPLLTVPLSLAALYYYPGSDRWTPARGDTTVILGTYLGVHLGAWANYQLGYTRPPPDSSHMPFPIMWPNFEQIYGHTLLRMIVGGVTFVAIKAVFKSLTYKAACFYMDADPNEVRKQPCHIDNKPKIVAELTYKFVTYVAIGFDVLFIAPWVFQAIGIERSKFYTEL